MWRHLLAATILLQILLFVGETEEQFQRTIELVRQVGFDRVNTAAYSPRPNTPAAEVTNQVPYEYTKLNVHVPHRTHS